MVILSVSCIKVEVDRSGSSVLFDRVENGEVDEAVGAGVGVGGVVGVF